MKKRIRIIKKFEFARDSIFYKNPKLEFNAWFLFYAMTRKKPTKSKWTSEYFNEPISE